MLRGALNMHEILLCSGSTAQIWKDLAVPIFSTKIVFFAGSMILFEGVFSRKGLPWPQNRPVLVDLLYDLFRRLYTCYFWERFPSGNNQSTTHSKFWINFNSGFTEIVSSCLGLRHSRKLFNESEKIRDSTGLPHTWNMAGKQGTCIRACRYRLGYLSYQSSFYLPI